MQNMKLLTQREKNVSEKVGYPYIIYREIEGYQVFIYVF